MMFLQFFVWGAWYVTVGNYMDKIGMGGSIGDAYTVAPIAALISPFFLGMIADRFFATERILAVMHLLGGVIMLLAPTVAQTGSSMAFIGVLLLHMLCYMPTLGLTNSLAFHNLTNQEKQFPLIRVFGTIGWIAAGVLVSKYLKADESPDQFYVTGGAAILLGVFSFSLPHTPPPSKGKSVTSRDVLGLDALGLLKKPSFLVFLLGSMLICIPLAGYYAYAQLFVKHAGFHNPAFTMSFGQVSEVLFMLIMPLCFRSLGVKWMLVIGMLAWVARYSLFSASVIDGTMWMILIGILLHGICYDFFFVTGQIYVDKVAPVNIRGQAQGLLVMATQGLGLGIGAQVFQRLVNGNALAGSPAVVEVATRKQAAYAETMDGALQSVEHARQLLTEIGPPPIPPAEYAKLAADSADALRYVEWKSHGSQLAQEAGTFLSGAEQSRQAAESMWRFSSRLLLETYNWQHIWYIPAMIAGVVVTLFILAFRDTRK